MVSTKAMLRCMQDIMFIKNVVSLILIICSNILKKDVSKDIGLWFLGSAVSPLLKTGIILAIFKRSGKIPSHKDLLIHHYRSRFPYFHLFTKLAVPILSISEKVWSSKRNMCDDQAFSCCVL